MRRRCEGGSDDQTKGILHVTIPVSDRPGAAPSTRLLGSNSWPVPKENPHFVFLKSGADYACSARTPSRGRFSDIITMPSWSTADAYDATVAELKSQGRGIVFREINATKASYGRSAISTTLTTTPRNLHLTNERRAEGAQLEYFAAAIEIMRA